LAQKGAISAIVTAPVAKIAMHKAGHVYNGQTEVLQKYLSHDNQKAEMLFVANDFRVLLLTRHVALKDINITYDLLIEKISKLNTFFKEKFHIKYPEFALCALNPHAGEGGIMGDEEKNIIIPAAEKLRAIGVNVTNPQPADTLFIPAAKRYLKLSDKPIYDCYIAMYHDQGLIPIKSVAADKTVNTTIGLDVIRTSPSHGTAFNLAGKNSASYASMIEAIKEALQFI
jgi:4-hydroxythreonine-4-phosphate dehydrogenase